MVVIEIWACYIVCKGRCEKSCQGIITNPRIVRRILIQRSALHPEMRRIPTGGTRVGLALTSLIGYAQKKLTKNSNEDDKKH